MVFARHDPCTRQYRLGTDGAGCRRTTTCRIYLFHEDPAWSRRTGNPETEQGNPSRSGSAPLNRSELHDAIPELADIQGTSWGLDIKGLAFTGALVLADSDNVETRFARRDVWLPNLSWEPPLRADAQRELLLHYLTAYGPSTLQDFAHWSGLKMKTVQSIFAACMRELIKAEVAGWHGDHYLRCQDEPLLQVDDEAPSAICLIPKFDPLLMGYKDKTRFIDEENLS